MPPKARQYHTRLTAQLHKRLLRARRRRAAHAERQDAQRHAARALVVVVVSRRASDEGKCGNVQGSLYGSKASNVDIVSGGGEKWTRRPSGAVARALKRLSGKLPRSTLLHLLSPLAGPSTPSRRRPPLSKRHSAGRMTAWRESRARWHAAGGRAIAGSGWQYRSGGRRRWAPNWAVASLWRATPSAAKKKPGPLHIPSPSDRPSLPSSPSGMLSQRSSRRARAPRCDGQAGALGLLSQRRRRTFSFASGLHRVGRCQTDIAARTARPWLPLSPSTRTPP